MGACFTCNDCGACKEGLPRLKPTKCPHCGKPVFVGDAYCASCGEELSAETETNIATE